MNIVVLNGSPRKKHSHTVIKSIENMLSHKGLEVNMTYLDLHQLDIRSCIGCMQCFQKGEEACPLKDDVKALYQHLLQADGFIFASPVYALQVTGQMKQAVDRLSFLFHRPALIDKPVITLVTTEGGGIKPTQHYLQMMAYGWGCRLSGTISVMSSRYFKTSPHHHLAYQERMDQHIHKTVQRFYDDLQQKNPPSPTFRQLYYFYGLKSKTYIYKADYDFWASRGWLDARYYYPVRLNPAKQLFASVMDGMIKMTVKLMLKTEAAS